MESFELFSERQQKASDILKYDDFSKELRVQIIYICREALGSKEDYRLHNSSVFKTYKYIIETLRETHGKYIHLVHENTHYSTSHESYIEELEEFLLTEKDVNRVLDAVELAFRIIDRFTRNFDYFFKIGADEVASNAIEKLNMRFKRHGVGYQFESGKIIKMSSIFTHEEIVKPALTLLQDPRFAGAQDEFLKAHTHDRNNQVKESINECLKSFESTMKSICKENKWDFPENATAKKLIEVCFDNELIPRYWESCFAGLRTILESGISTARNKESGHGQGFEVKVVPRYLSSSIINMTATTILFLVGALIDMESATNR